FSLGPTADFGPGSRHRWCRHAYRRRHRHARYGHHATSLRRDLQAAAPPLNFAESAAGYQQLYEHLQRIAGVPPFGKKLIYAKNPQALSIPARFADPSVTVDVQHIDCLDELIGDVELYLDRTVKVDDADTFYRLSVANSSMSSSSRNPTSQQVTFQP